MSERISPGDAAPDFDLSSTEEALLMLRDEVHRTCALLYFFQGQSDRVKADLRALGERHRELALLHTKVLGISAAKMDELKTLQAELGLRFPLLRDDRDFASKYGIETPEGGEAEPALFLVDRRQRVSWLASPVSDVKSVLAEVEKALVTDERPTSNYPKAVINRWVGSYAHKPRYRRDLS